MRKKNYVCRKQAWPGLATFRPGPFLGTEFHGSARLGRARPTGGPCRPLFYNCISHLWDLILNSITVQRFKQIWMKIESPIMPYSNLMERGFAYWLNCQYLQILVSILRQVLVVTGNQIKPYNQIFLILLCSSLETASSEVYWFNWGRTIRHWQLRIANDEPWVIVLYQRFRDCKLLNNSNQSVHQ